MSSQQVTQSDCITPSHAERLAYADWLDSYYLELIDIRVEAGESPEVAPLHAAAHVASMPSPDDEEWMSAARAAMVMLSVKLGHQPDPQQYADALRTQKGRDESEHGRAVAGFFGVDPHWLSRHYSKNHRDLAGRTAVYRYFDEGDRLLYVGIAKDSAVRDVQHAARSAWRKLSVRREVEWFESRPDALAAEREAIRSEGPMFNGLSPEASAEKALAHSTT